MSSIEYLQSIAGMFSGWRTVASFPLLPSGRLPKAALDTIREWESRGFEVRVSEVIIEVKPKEMK